MSPGAVLAVVTTLACVGLAARIGLRRERSRVSNVVAALLVFLAVWSAGSVLQELLGDSGWLVAARRVIFLGSFATPSLWLLLALHHAAPRLVRGRIGVPVALLAPASLFYVAALTNASHGWIIRPDATDAPGLASWAGPITWVFVVLATAATLAGSALFARTAWRLWVGGRRLSALWLALALAAQLACIAFTLAGPVPQGYALVPAGMAVAVFVVTVTALRHPVAESPPLGHREVLDHLRLGIVMAGASGEIRDLNPAACRMIGAGMIRGGRIGGATAEGVAGAALRERPFDDVLAAIAAEDDRPRLREGLADLVDAAEPRLLEIESADGRALEIRAFPLRDDQDQTLGLIAVLRDRTGERRFAEVARRTQKLESVGTLAAGISHEVNNPLAFVRANLAEIERLGDRVEQRRRSGPSKLAEDLAELGELAREALEGIARIDRAVSDVRRLSCAPTEGLGPVDPNELVREAVRLAALRGGGDAPVETDLGRVPAVEGAPQLLVQALLNLLVNAQQAVEGRSEARVRVSTRAEGDAVRIDVADDGPGVPEERRARVFEPFYTTRSDRGARGLGLTIAGDVARDHGGELRLEESGRGALLRLRLPAARSGG